MKVLTRVAATAAVMMAVIITFAPAVCTALEPDSLVVAGLDFDPDALNLKSNGRWVTCYIELPEGHDPDSVDVAGVVLCDSLYAIEFPTAVGDHDGDEIDELMVKFVRADVGAMLAPGDSVEVWVTGMVGDVGFYGADTIRVFWPGDEAQNQNTARERLRVRQNSPNPFNPKTVVVFSIPSASHVTFEVHDAAGRLVATLIDRHMEDGEHSIEWNGVASDGTPVGSGVYFYTVTAGEFSETRKGILLK